MEARDFLMFSNFGSKFTRLHAELLVEAFRKVGRIVEADHIADLIDAVLMFHQELCCFLESHKLDKLVRGAVGKRLYLIVE